ncbi:MAG: hypothetical protein K2G35_07995 [Duncaniella sp.]|nr:hypothetical protein [Duncaniella sp.]
MAVIILTKTYTYKTERPTQKVQRKLPGKFGETTRKVQRNYPERFRETTQKTTQRISDLVALYSYFEIVELSGRQGVLIAKAIQNTISNVFEKHTLTLTTLYHFLSHSL